MEGKWIKYANRDPVHRCGGGCYIEEDRPAPGGSMLSDVMPLRSDSPNNMPMKGLKQGPGPDQKPLPEKYPIIYKAAPGVKTEQPQ